MTRDERHELVLALARHIYNGMDWYELREFVAERLYKDYLDYTDEELMAEVEEYAPHLIDKEEDDG